MLGLDISSKEVNYTRLETICKPTITLIQVLCGYITLLEWFIDAVVVSAPTIMLLIYIQYKAAMTSPPTDLSLRLLLNEPKAKKTKEKEIQGKNWNSLRGDHCSWTHPGWLPSFKATLCSNHSYIHDDTYEKESSRHFHVQLKNRMLAARDRCKTTNESQSSEHRGDNNGSLANKPEPIPRRLSKHRQGNQLSSFTDQAGSVMASPLSSMVTTDSAISSNSGFGSFQSEEGNTIAVTKSRVQVSSPSCLYVKSENYVKRSYEQPTQNDYKNPFPGN